MAEMHTHWEFSSFNHQKSSFQTSAKLVHMDAYSYEFLYRSTVSCGMPVRTPLRTNQLENSILCISQAASFKLQVLWIQTSDIDTSTDAHPYGYLPVGASLFLNLNFVNFY